MSLTIPEIDLLLEVLNEDPSDEAYREVARALAARGDLIEAVAVLRRALDANQVPPSATGPRADDARLLASWAVEVGELDAVGVAVQALGEPTLARDPTLARALALYHDHRGQFGRAAELANALLAENPDDPELQAVVDRSMAAAPDVATRGVDPFYTAGRAEAYCDIGRPDLAVRVLRRILSHQRDDAAVHARLLQLRVQPPDPRPWVDDLSEEYWVNRPMAPLAMPAPGITPALVAAGSAGPSDEEAPTVPVAPERDVGPGGRPPPYFNALPPDDDDAFEGAGPDDDEATVVITEELLRGAGLPPRGGRR